MMASPIKPQLVIAGPGAGKTHNMVEQITNSIHDLSLARYMAVITYTNSATYNIQNRLVKKITIPDNLFIGTIHSFLNKFIVIPYASLVLENIGQEKLFLQCQTDHVLSHVKKMQKKKTLTVEQTASLKANIKNNLKKRGYITFDQTVAIAKECMENKVISKIVANRIQHLFIDEFQDTDNAIFSIVENIRKQKTTTIYCVGDPEQYIKSFDSTQRSFANIPILKMANSSSYQVHFNNLNYRSSQKIVEFINQFNKRSFNGNIFQQISKSDKKCNPVKFITKYENATHILPEFFSYCDLENIKNEDRCIVAKKNDVIKKIASVLGQKYLTPKKNKYASRLNTMKETLLSTLRLSQNDFCEQYKANVYTLRAYSLQILKAIDSGEIHNENSYVNFVMNGLKLNVVEGLPVKVENFKHVHDTGNEQGYVTLCNIHTIKGLEAEAVLAVAKTEAELLLWLETNLSVRDAKRKDEDTDYPRLGYVAFSRAKSLLCVACLEKVSDTTIQRLKVLGFEVN